jgi:long-chain acyl-CoA synthetase
MAADERLWLKNYPKGVPSEIDIEGYTCLVDLINDTLVKFKDRPAFTSIVAGSTKTLSFAEIDQKSRAFGQYLQSLGLKPGDRIALMMPNLLQYPIALYGALRAGLKVVNTNPLYTAREIEHQFNDAGVTAVVIAENFAHELEKVIHKTGVKHTIVASIGEMFGGLKGWFINFAIRTIKKMVPKYNLPGHLKFKKCLNAGDASKLQMHKSDLEEVIALQYTGGTTGVAKGAMLTNKNLLYNMFQVKAWIGAADLKEGYEVVLTPLPLYHIFSFCVNCLCMGSYGGENVLVVNPRDIPGLTKIIAQTKPTLMTGVNTLFNALLNDENFRALDFSNLKVVVGGAMAIQRPVAERWKEVTGVTLTEGYGMTEASPVVSVNPLGDGARIGTIGMPVPSTELRICDEDNKPLPLGEAGEIQVRGPQVMKGYLNRPEATANTIIEGGWLRTGDVGVMDEDGFVKIVDRIKDMILVSGFNVYPNEIEEVIAGHDKVLEVAAVGVYDEKSSEAVKVFVVKNDDSLTEEELRAYCKENLTGYKKPKHYEFRDELPKTNVGKILRRALRDEERAKRGA